MQMCNGIFTCESRFCDECERLGKYCFCHNAKFAANTNDGWVFWPRHYGEVVHRYQNDKWIPDHTVIVIPSDCIFFD